MTTVTPSPLTPQATEAFFNDLAAMLDFPPKCDHTLRFSSVIARRSGCDWSSLRAWLRDNGGYCDCEAMFNVAIPLAELHDLSVAASAVTSDVQRRHPPRRTARRGAKLKGPPCPPNSRSP